MAEPVLFLPVLETENIGDKLFSPLSLRHIRAINIKERVRLNDVRRDIDLACRMTVFEIEHASKLMRKRQERLRAQLQSRKGRTTATSSGDSMRFSRSHTWQGKVKPLHHYNGATFTPLVGGGTVRRNSGGKRPDKRPGCAGNVIAFGSEGDVNYKRAPNATANPNVTTVPLIVIQSPDEDSTNTLSPEARDEHATPGGDDSSHLLSATLRADDAERGGARGARGLRVPAMRIGPKGICVHVTEGEDETETPDGVLPGRIGIADKAILSWEKDPRKDMPDVTHTSGDAYQKIRLFSGGKQTDKTKNSDEKKQSYRTPLERTGQADITPTQTSGETDPKIGTLQQYSDTTDTSCKTDTSTRQLSSQHMFSLPPLYSLKPGRHRWRDLSGTMTTGQETAVPQLRDVKWCRYLRYPSGKGRPSDVPDEYT
ncbi:hypothetical protein LSAT2_003944 [Lamellibrachia satsuma]|nr:hypothetical protein LSAT2_003944 [Lamellibrachia satsuma]